MKKLLTYIIVASVICGSTGNISCTCSRSNEYILDDIASWVASTRGLAKLSDIEYEFITTDDLRQHLLEQFDFENSQQEMEDDEDLLQILGFLDEDDDLYTILLDLYTEQIAGYYDIETKKLYVISNGGSLSVSDKITFAHEVTHALQDQHYDLEGLDELAGDDSEYSAALTSLIEGDAVLLQSAYYWTGLSQRERDIFAQESEQTDSDSYDEAPPYLQQSLIFPYDYGLEFVLYLYNNGAWDAVDAAYDSPPKSTEQIIHPDKYMAADDPVPVTLPDLETLLGEDWITIEEGTVGEFDLRMTLEAFIEPSEDTESAAAGWGGDAYAFLEDNASGDQLLVIYSTWDSEVEAQQFFDTYAENRSDDMWTSATAQTDIKAWQSTDGYLYLEKSGDYVLLINAPDVITADMVRDGILT